MVRLQPKRYTISHEAHRNLLSQFSSYTEPTHQTTWARQPDTTILGSQAVHTDNVGYTYAAGLSHALNTCASNYDLYEWLPKPTLHPYTYSREPVYYNPPDPFYLADMAMDDTPWSALSTSEQQDRLQELHRIRGWHPTKSLDRTKKPGYGSLSLSLRPSTRKYFHQLRIYHHIPLLPNCRTPNSLTTSISACLEAIGTSHLVLPAPEYYLKTEPNFNQSYAAKHRRYAAGPGRNSGPRKYGNFDSTPYKRREWRAIPPIASPELWTQDDIDYCTNNPSLADLVQPILASRPDLTTQLPDSATPTTLPPPVWGSQPSQPNNQPIRSKPAIAEPIPQLPGTGPTYLYKGKDVTELVNLAHDLHYELGWAWSRIANEHNTDLQAIQRLVSKEHVRRLYSHDY